MAGLTDITFQDGDTRLAGSVRLPAATPASPGVVFIHGSGTLTRNAWYGWPEQLADRGVATLAYDKPGCGVSEGDWTVQNLEDRARESLEALRCLAAQPGVDPRRVGFLGLSQGCWVAPLAASMSEDVAFVISLSGAGVSPAVQEAYRIEQELSAEGFSPEETTTALAVFHRRIERLRRGADADEIWNAEEEARREPWFSFLGGATPDRLAFVLGIYDFDPRPALERTQCPVLAIWGDRDILVPVEASIEAFQDALSKGGNGCFELRTLEGADHELQLVDGSPPEAQDVFARRLVESLAAWIRSTRATDGRSVS